jgi:uncharacterized membrane protein
MQTQNKLYRNLFYYVIGYGIISPFVWFLTGDFLHAFLAWNLLLGFVPLFLAKRIAKNNLHKPGIILGLSLVWLLFFPNSFYMITDLIYLSERVFVSQANPYAEIIYSTNILDWLSMSHILIGILISVVAGTYSLELMFQFGQEKLGKKWAFSLLICVCFLSSIGIYIGRFFRYNSWNFLAIVQIIQDIVHHLGWFSVLFILLFTILQLTIFGLLYPWFTTKKPRLEMGVITLL